MFPVAVSLTLYGLEAESVLGNGSCRCVTLAAPPGSRSASAVVVAGFYLLWLGFVEGNALKAVPGAILIPAGLYLMVSSRRAEIRREDNEPIETDTPTDPQQ